MSIADANAELARGGAPLENARVCMRDGDPWHARTLLADVTIDGVVASLELDTGADELMLDADSDAARSLMSHRALQRGEASSAGGSVTTGLAEDVPLRLAATEMRISLSIGPEARDPKCRRDGRLGIRELSRCLLVIRETDIAGACRR